ncbi:MAG: outer membrane protein assembly factor BamA [Saprospiraceae bacterium]|nr:outer membrane protein assembly factor BamA [Saprospiraceae bacterium]MBP9744402.1 outer membrane protein assembly factor BamA [Saprospiraceae bacterium]
MKIFSKFLLFAIFLLFATIVSYSQQDTVLPFMDYDLAKPYEIGKITVTGTFNSDANAIIGVTGLKSGSKITVPGPEIQKAIRSLWNLKLFTEVDIINAGIDGSVMDLEIHLEEKARLARYSYTGIKKSQHEELNNKLKRFVGKNDVVNESKKQTAINEIKSYFRDKGYYDVGVKVLEKRDTKMRNAVVLEFEIDTKERVKIDEIIINGNVQVTDKKLRSKMSDTKQKGKIFGKSKLVKADFEKDKIKLIKYYNTVGFRDARIAKDSVWRTEDGALKLELFIDEGPRFYIGDITWKGNSIHEAKQLNAYLRIKKGDIYNQELLDQRLRFSQDGSDVSSLYMDDGYLFFRVEPVEVSINSDSIDLEMRIYEGPQATIDKVSIVGNDRTHEHVIRRELRTRPGEKFSRSNIIRSQRQIINLGYFNQETVDIGTDVNPERGTVDITYSVEEKPSDQLELSAGWGGFQGVIGTLGVTFNNFAVRNLFNKKQWDPLPTGDGQKLSLRGQSNGKFYQSYNFSFTEPWLGGKKANSFTLGAFLTKFNQELFGLGKLQIARGYIGLGSQLRWPDDNFVTNTTLNIENINISGSLGSDRSFVDPRTRQPILGGSYNNFSIKQTFARNTIYDPLFPRFGTNISLTIALTPPYSLLGKAPNTDGTPQELYKWVEYHKWRLDAQWYATLIGKLVLKMQAKMGLLGFYNKKVGLTPFERFELGGDGLSNQNYGVTGRDILALRGYEVADLAANEASNGGATIFNKFTMELRYPLTLNPSSSIFLLSFLEGGNAWIGSKNYNPFELKRTGGLGMRVFLPMFGLLGFDYGFGFDKIVPEASKGKLGSYGKFSIILGFEPD